MCGPVCLQRLIAQDRFVCQFNIEGRVTTVQAQLLGSDIYCEDMEFNYLGKQPNITAAFAVIWGSGKPLDNPEDVRGGCRGLNMSGVGVEGSSRQPRGCQR